MIRIAILLGLLCPLVSPLWAEEPVETEVFRSGTEGYHTFRIPSLVVTKKGTLLAFCEGRKKGRSDTGDIDLVLRRSSDGGRTWSPLAVVWDDAGHTCGNPCAVVDQSTGTVWLLMTWNDGAVHERDIAAGHGADSRRVFVAHSTDDGQSWAEPREITPHVKEKDWTWYATGPGAGIQLERGEHAGRLVIPCDHKTREGDETKQTERGYSHVIYSDDAGRSWRLGGATPSDKCNESEVVELADGRLMLNMRSYDPRVKARRVSVSDDGGATWSEPEIDRTLIEPICQGSIRRYRWPLGEIPGAILFSNPASTERRERLTIRASLDDGATWKHERLLYEGSAAYSCLAVLPEGEIGCLYERDDYGRIVLARFGWDWLAGEGEE
jgi:sialidase-1